MPRFLAPRGSRAAARWRKGRGLWGLLTCVEAVRDSDEEDETVQEASTRGSLAASQRHARSLRRRQQLAAEAADGRRKKSRRLSRPEQVLWNRGRQQSGGGGGGGGGGKRVPREGRDSDTRGKRRRRLVIAMLEDETARSGVAEGDPRNLRLRATRDEFKIRRILNQIGATMDSSNANLAELSTLDIPASLKSSMQAGTASTVKTSRTMTMQQSPSQCPTQPQPQPQPPKLPPAASSAAPKPPQPLQPKRRQQTKPQPQQPQPQQLQLQLPQPQPQSQPQPQPQSLLQAQRPPQEQPQQPDKLGSYSVAQFPQKSGPQSPARNSGRRGYRLFSRVFSAADNYYAVPFPPLEDIKLNKDDDQWEDLEIYVASHRGITSIKPKVVDPKAPVTSWPANSLAAHARKLPIASQRPAARSSGPPPSKPPPPTPQPPPRPPPTQQQQQQQQKLLALLAAKNPAAGDQPATEKCPQPPQQQRPSQQKPPQQPASSKAPTNQGDNSKLCFGCNYQQPTQRQRRGPAVNSNNNPLSPAHLLKQLPWPVEPAGKAPPPPKSARPSQIPLFHWEPTGKSQARK